MHTAQLNFCLPCLHCVCPITPDPPSRYAPFRAHLRLFWLCAPRCALGREEGVVAWYRSFPDFLRRFGTHEDR